MKTVLLTASALLLALPCLFCLWVLCCVFIGLFARKQPQLPAAPKRFAVISCARNEEAVISALIDSVRRQDYPPEMLRMFVVAHNCTDATADRAREAGAEVFVRNEPSDRCKGDALRFGIQTLLEQYPGEFDCIAVFDADNLASRGFLREMNAALEQADVVQGFRASKNGRTNRVTQLFGAFWLAMSDFQNLAHTRLDLPTCVSGTGFAFRLSALPPEGWRTETFLEDVEFSVQQFLLGHRVRSAESAVFYDEQPERLRDGLRQRFRWALGMQAVMKRYAPALLRAAAKRGRAAVKLLGDICINAVFTSALLGFLCLFAGLVCAGITPRRLLCGLLLLLVLLWLLSLPVVLALLRKERLPLSRNLPTLFLFAPFLFLSVLFGAAAWFVTDTVWTPIAHTDARGIAELEQEADRP